MTRKKQIIHLILAVSLVLLGILGYKALTASRKEIHRSRPVEVLPLVRVIIVQTGSRTVSVISQGTVRPVREIEMVPEVKGKVIHISPMLIDGGIFNKGDLLLRIDPADYEIAVTLAMARVKDSESKFQLTREEADVACQEWQQLYGLGKIPPPLVAKEPQLAASLARLTADKANMEKAKLNLRRTRLVAPFNGRVSHKQVDIGQYVSPGQSLARLFSTGAAEIVLPMEDKDLFWFKVPGFTTTERQGALARIIAEVAGQELSWSGRVVRTQAKLDERTRMINVIVRVEKPYANKPPLAMGLFVSVSINGRVLEDAALLPRSALRENQVVWVVDDKGRLKFRQVDIARISTHGVLIRKGLRKGEKVVVSFLEGITDGMRVRSMLVQGEKVS